MPRLGDTTLGSIGAGNMARAILEGLLAADMLAPKQIHAADPNPDARAPLATRGIHVSATNDDAWKADVVLLAVKPQILPAVLQDGAGRIRPEALLISIAAGVRIATIRDHLGDEVRVIRVMPNTPLLVGAGVSCIAPGSGVTEGDLCLAMELFGACGHAYRVEESQLDAVTALSGSGPAYVFAFCEALAKAGAAAGLPASLAGTLARQTLVGAARMLEMRPDPPGRLREQVTSPGGTTEAALRTLQAEGWERVITDAVAAACARSKELAGDVPPTDTAPPSSMDGRHC